MSRRWDALNARARGLGTHLLRRHELEALARAPDLAALAEGLRAAGFPVAEGDERNPAALELAVRRRAAARLATLGRWCGPRSDAAAILYEDEERRSLRTMLRGASERAAPDLRLAGTLPTPALPERALEELARQPTPRAVAALLLAWRHPYGAALLAALGSGPPDLLRMEIALNRRFAERALGLARGGPLAAYVRQTIDLENAFAALVLAARPEDMTPKEAFIPDGQHIGITQFEEAVAAGNAAAAATRLHRAFGDAPVARAFAPGAELAAAEPATLRLRLAALRRAARTDPLGPAPLLGFVLGLRAETADLRRLIWGLSLTAPRAQLAGQLVTV